jgi:hypothetical protein
LDKQPQSDSSKPHSRLEDEVLEILHRTDRPVSNVVKFRSRVRSNRNSFRDRFRIPTGRLHVTGLSLLVASLVLAVLAAFVDDSSPLLGQVLALGSIAAFVWLYVRGFRGPDRNSTKSWRGRDIDFSPSSRPDWLNRRFGGPKRPRR